MWIKRDDLNASLAGGNKARALEFLLGKVVPGDTVIAVGGAGSTHILSTALHASRLGAKTVAFRWGHDMNPVADLVSGRIAEFIPGAVVSRGAVVALLKARYRSMGAHIHYIPIGGSTPLGALGHVNAALELALQIERGEMPMPESIVLPLGSGGTAAGLILGLSIAGLKVTVVGARVGPRMFVNRARVLGLVSRTKRLIERVTGEGIKDVDPALFRIEQGVYGGAYGRALPEARAAAEILHRVNGVRLDDTYSGKAWVAALSEGAKSRGPILFWLTFDPSCLTN